MSTPIESNTEELQEILSMIDDLPNAGGIDKCTPQLFGAVGDGTTDDSAAFNDWFEYLADNDVVGYIPNGTYLVKSGIGYAPTDPSGKRISFIGESADRTIIKAGFADPTDKNVIAFQNCYIGEFGNLTIDNNETYADEDGTTGFQMLDMQYTEKVFSWIHDINIINVGRRAGLIYSSGGAGHVAIKYVNMERINVVGFTSDRNMWGEHPTDGGHINPTPVGIIAGDVSHFHFINCTARNIHYYPLEFKNYTEYCSHENCVIENCGQGIYLGQEWAVNGGDPDTIGHRYYKAIGNVIKDVPIGVMASNLAHCTFDNNTIISLDGAGDATGFAFNAPCEFVTGTGNSYYGDRYAVQFRKGNAQEAYCHDNVIETAIYKTAFTTPYDFAEGSQRCVVVATNYQQTAKTRVVDANKNAYIPVINVMTEG